MSRDGAIKQSNFSKWTKCEIAKKWCEKLQSEICYRGVLFVLLHPSRLFWHGFLEPLRTSLKAPRVLRTTRVAYCECFVCHRRSDSASSPLSYDFHGKHAMIADAVQIILYLNGQIIPMPSRWWFHAFAKISWVWAKNLTRTKFSVCLLCHSSQIKSVVVD